ncbi:3-oxoacyl-ACP synthase [Sphingomonas sp. SUN039]|uniref:3-oxoacyl-ACP synthase n=1 Tax=Sphingomonas sp. SUN039 TaxID=2937787 RepID=UPI002164A3B1|nr:3-oxoacyl-ACP synthase [Sphingomonas sp. SUN039]UVO53483.1 3-oxoacyl-ACP synthase [Sphingomonas sp. SUN039]
MAAIVPLCFEIDSSLPATPVRVAPSARLTDDAAAALAMLIPLLGCGEEAAAMAFDALSDIAAFQIESEALGVIASEERVHDALLRGIRAALPVPVGTERLLVSARRFHIRLQSGGPTAHLARIAALDAAVCLILGRLTQRQGAVARDPVICGVLRRIRNDEARHVAVARQLVMRHGTPAALRDTAAAARCALADTLGLVGDAFERLAVDPAVLDRGIRQLPDGLLKA